MLDGRLDEGAAHAGLALALARDHGEHGNEARVLRIRGEIARRRGDLTVADADLGEARALSERLTMRPLVGHCYVSLARARWLAGDRVGAARHLAAARELFTAIDMHAWADRSDGELLGD